MQADIWAPLAEGCRPQKWAAGQMIYLQDTEANQFYYILSGTVKCFISWLINVPSSRRAYLA